jgi:hypothetical protein
VLAVYIDIYSMSSYLIGMLHLAPFLFLACAPRTGEAELAGFVHTPDGAPIVGATIVAEIPRRALASGDRPAPVTTVTGADGGYTLHLPADGLQQYSVQVGVGGHDEPPTRLTVHAGQHLTKDFSVRSTREVALRCAGFAEESCWDIPGARCSSRDGAGEDDDTKDTTVELDGNVVLHRSIECPAGADVVVHLGGEEVVVPASEDVARLDFTAIGGGVRGRLASDAQNCRVSAHRPFLGFYLGAYPDDTRYVRTTGGEPFVMDHLPPGPWVIKAACFPESSAAVTVEVEDGVVDLGVLALE